MRGGMANNSSQAHNAQSPSRPPPRDHSPDPPMGRGCCTGFLCLGSLKRGKRIVPATRMHDSNNTTPRPWASNGAPQSNPANQYATLSPSLLAPPSSPASFQNSAVQSSAQSPCAYPAVSGPSATSQIPLERAQTMFQMGPYAHETALVSPPVFSNFTTAPSTAPFTPPPELASHLTTPSSPDVPFAQLLANSFGTKQTVRLQPAPTYSASPFASPDIFAADDLQAAYQLYPGSPLAHLLSPASGTGASTPFPDLDVSTQFTPFQDLENPVQVVASMFLPGSAFMQSDPPTSMELEVVNSCSFQDFGQGEQQLAAKISSFLSCGDDPSGPKLTGYAEQLIVGVNTGSEASQTTKQAGPLGNAPEKETLEEDKNAEVAGECISKHENDVGLAELVSLDGISSTQHGQSKLEASDPADRNTTEAAACNLSSAEASNEYTNVGNGLSDDISAVQQEQCKRDASDEADRNISRIATCNLGSSDTSSEFPSTGNSVPGDISSIQQEQGKQESSDEADRNISQTATCNLGSSDTSSKFPSTGNSVLGDISSIQQEQGKQESSDEADRNVSQTATCNLGTSDTSDTSSEFPSTASHVPGEISSVQQEQGKQESPDEADRNFSQTATCNLGTSDTSSEFPSTASCVPGEISSVQQEQGKRESVDEAGRNLCQTATVNLGSSDTSSKISSTEHIVLSDISSVREERGNDDSAGQAGRDLTQSVFCNVRFTETSKESTGEGNDVSDDISFAQLEQGKHEFSTPPDRNLTRTVICNLVPKVSNKLSYEGNRASNKISSVHQEVDKSESADQIDRNLRRSVVGALWSSQTVTKSPSQRNDVVDSTNIPVQSEVHSGTLFTSSLLGLTIGDLVAWETSTGDKIPGKLSISKIALMETSRNGSAIHSRSSSKDSSARGTSPVTRRTSPVTRRSSGGTSPVTRVNGRTSPVTRLSSGGTSPVTRISNGRTSPVTRLSSGGTSPVTRLSNGGSCNDCVRLQHVTVAASEGYFDISSAQKFTFTGQKFEANANCNKETLQDCIGRRKPENERGVLKVLLEHTMENPVGVEVIDRVAIYREQQLNVPVK